MSKNVVQDQIIPKGEIMRKDNLKYDEGILQIIFQLCFEKIPF